MEGGGIDNECVGGKPHDAVKGNNGVGGRKHGREISHATFKGRSHMDGKRLVAVSVDREGAHDLQKIPVVTRRAARVANFQFINPATLERGTGGCESSGSKRPGSDGAENRRVAMDGSRAPPPARHLAKISGGFFSGIYFLRSKKRKHGPGHVSKKTR